MAQNLTPACVPGQDGAGYRQNQEKEKEKKHHKKPLTSHSEKDKDNQGTINTTTPQKKRENSTGHHS